MKKLLILMLTCYFLLFNLSAFAITKNGFILDDASIPVGEILKGGVKRDGIFALTYPDFVEAKQAEWLAIDDRILGVQVGKIAKAYSIKMLDVHEIVNDKINNQYFTVSFCPLCGTGIVFATNFGENNALNFGVSGLLYNSDLLLYDRNSESLWSQITGEAIVGKLKGIVLPRLPVIHTTWGEWQKSHPKTLVMSGDERFEKRYRRSAYLGYAKSREIYYKVKHPAPRKYHSKEWVLGVNIEGIYKAYPFKELKKNGLAKFVDTIGSQKLVIHWNSKAKSAKVTNQQGKAIVSTMGYWFAWYAWYAFYPDTLVFKAN